MAGIGDLIWQLAGKQDPRAALMAQVAGGDTSATPAPAQDTSGGAGTAPGTGAPAASATTTGPMPEALKSTPDMMSLYTDLMNKENFDTSINRGLGLIFSSMAYDENKQSILDAYGVGSGGGGAAGSGGLSSGIDLMNSVMKLRTDQAALAQKAAHRAALPAIAKQYGLDLETAQYLFDSGKLDSVIAEAEKPDNQIIQGNDGRSYIVDKSTGAISAPLGPEKKREIELVTNANTGEQTAVYKDTKEPVAGRKPVVEGQRKTEMVEGQNGEKFAVYSDTKERVDGKPVVEGQRKTEVVTNSNTGEQTVVYSDTKEPVPGRQPLVKGVRKTEYQDTPEGGKRLVFADDKSPVGTGDMASIGSTDKAKLWHDAMVDRKARGLPEVPLDEWLTKHERSSAADANSIYGNPPTDMAWKRDDKGEIVTKDGVPQPVPLPGTKLEKETKIAEAAAKSKDRMKGITSNVVTDNIDRAIKLIDDNSDTMFPVTGVGGLLADLPLPTDAGSLADKLDTIKANIGFDKLNDIRASNTTGGGLGPISDFENKLLQATYGSLRQTGQEADIKYNLNRVKKLYTYLATRPDDAPITSLEQAEAIMGPPPAGTTDDPEVDELLKKYGKK